MLKNLQHTILAVVVLVATSGCSLFEKDIEVPQEFSYLLDKAANDDPHFSLVQDKDTNDEDIEEHRDQIKDSKIEKITFTVSDFNGQGAPSITANLMFAAKGVSSFKALGSVSSADLKELSTSGREVTVNIGDESTKNALKDMIIGGDIITFKMEGSSSSTPVHAKLNFKIYSNITVGI